MLHKLRRIIYIIKQKCIDTLKLISIFLKRALNTSILVAEKIAKNKALSTIAVVLVSASISAAGFMYSWRLAFRLIIAEAVFVISQKILRWQYGY